MYARSVPTDVMPGPNDPSNYHLPQQPLNKCLLPRSSKLKALNRTTNPYSATIGGVSYVIARHYCLSINLSLDVGSWVTAVNLLIAWSVISMLQINLSYLRRHFYGGTWFPQLQTALPAWLSPRQIHSWSLNPRTFTSVATQNPSKQNSWQVLMHIIINWNASLNYL